MVGGMAARGAATGETGDGMENEASREKGRLV